VNANESQLRKAEGGGDLK